MICSSQSRFQGAAFRTGPGAREILADGACVVAAARQAVRVGLVQRPEESGAAMLRPLAHPDRGEVAGAVEGGDRRVLGRGLGDRLLKRRDERPGLSRTRKHQNGEGGGGRAKDHAANPCDNDFGRYSHGR